ncbi:MAG: FAD-binding oxidoreductase [Chloroflexi bacterium]|nr:FAD-binding oxidoreductase [Chloroflexota bacterium]
MNPTADVVVIGGGVLGCSTALQLAMKGAKHITLLEKGAQVAVGASGASGGLVRMHYTVAADVCLAWRSLYWWQRWREWVGEPSPFVNSGFVMLVGREDGETLKANVQMMQRLGVDTHLITLDDLRELVPGIHTGDLDGASYEPQSGYAYPVDATHAMAARARERGVKIMLNTTATRLRTQSGRITGVETNAGLIEAGTVVLAAGAWSGALAQTAGVTLELTPKRVMAANTGRPQGFGRHPVIIDRASGLYTRNDRNDRNLFGLEPTLPVAPDAPEAFEVPAGALERGAQSLAHRLPPMARSNDPVGWAAPDGYGRDGHAILGAASEVGGLYLATGGSGSNFKTAPAIGEALAELIVDGRTTHTDIAPFRASRFAEGQPLTGAHEYDLRMVGESPRQAHG